jgi:hypothetical protein
MSTKVLYIDNNNVIELQSLTNDATGVVDTGATVTVTIQDTSGDSVAGQVWPATLSLVSESPLTGKYRATLDYDLVLLANRKYRAVVTAVGSGGEVGKWEVPAVARVRTT